MNTTTNTQENQTQSTPVKPQLCNDRAFVAPDVNIYENKEGYVLQAEIPGVPKDGLDINLEGSTLTIIGRRVAPELKGEALYRESSRFDYRRVFELDPAIEATKIEARVEQGILTLRLPKSEAVKPRKITVAD